MQFSKVIAIIAFTLSVSAAPTPNDHQQSGNNGNVVCSNVQKNAQVCCNSAPSSSGLLTFADFVSAECNSVPVWIAGSVSKPCQQNQYSACCDYKNSGNGNIVNFQSCSPWVIV